MSLNEVTCPGCKIRIRISHTIVPGEPFQCTFCGKQIISRKRASVSAPATPAPVPADDVPDYDPSEDAEWAYLQRQQRRKMLTIVSLVVGAGLLIVVMIALINSGSDKPTEKERRVTQQPERSLPTYPHQQRSPEKGAFDRIFGEAEDPDSNIVRRIKVDDPKPTPARKDGEIEDPDAKPVRPIKVPEREKKPEPSEKKPEEDLTPEDPNLADRQDFDDFSIQPPKGWRMSRRSIGNSAMACLWQGPRRPDRSSPRFGIIILKQGPAKMTSQFLIQRFILPNLPPGQPPFTPGQNISINDEPLVYLESSPRNAGAGQMLMAYAGVKNNKGLVIIGEDRAPHHEKSKAIMSAAALTLKWK